MMGPLSLRDFLNQLDKEGELAHVTRKVDRSWEIAAVTRRVLAYPAPRRPALIYESVAGFDMPVVVGLYLNRRRYAKALGIDEGEIAGRWEAALRNPLPHKMVATGPCKERIMVGDSASLDLLPIPTWTPERDAAPYITAPCVIAKDPETGYINVGNYRMMYRGRDRTGIFINPIQDIGMIFEKYRRMGRPMEVAVALGVPPVMNLVATAKLPHGMNEMDVAGALIGTPLEMVRCETADLPVPATSEVVLEGEVDPEIRELEGPFGEFAGFMSTTYQMPIFKLRAMTCRDNPIYHAHVSQRPPSESSMMRSISNGALLLRDLRALGLRWVTDIYITEAGCAWYNLVVAIKKGHPAHPRVVMNAIWGAKPMMGKMIVVVDEDIDIRDPFQVEWAIATRVQPDRDVVIVKDYVGQVEDPSQIEEMRHLSSKMGIDATKKHPYPEPSLPPEKYMKQVAEAWEDYGIRPLEV